MISRTPLRPRSTRWRRNTNQRDLSSLAPGGCRSTRKPSELTALATKSETLRTSPTYTTHHEPCSSRFQNNDSPDPSRPRFRRSAASNGGNKLGLATRRDLEGGLDRTGADPAAARGVKMAESSRAVASVGIFQIGVSRLLALVVEHVRAREARPRAIVQHCKVPAQSRQLQA